MTKKVGLSFYAWVCSYFFVWSFFPGPGFPFFLSRFLIVSITSFFFDFFHFPIWFSNLMVCVLLLSCFSTDALYNLSNCFHQCVWFSNSIIELSRLHLFLKSSSYALFRSCLKSVLFNCVRFHSFLLLTFSLVKC